MATQRILHLVDDHEYKYADVFVTLGQYNDPLEWTVHLTDRTTVPRTTEQINCSKEDEAIALAKNFIEWKM